MTMMRSFPWQYGQTPAGDGPVAIMVSQGGIPHGASPDAPGKKVTPGARISPMGSAIYIPSTAAMLDRTLPPEYWGASPGNPS